MGEFRYRCVKVTTVDYGDSPASGLEATAHLSVIPDGTSWRERPATIDLAVPAGTRPGAIYRVLIEELPHA